MANLAISNNYRGCVPIAQEYPPRSVRETAVVPQRPYLGQGASNIPGLFNLYYVPYDLIATLRDKTQADRLGDVEGSNENWWRIYGTPFNISSSFFNNMDFIIKILSYFEIHPTGLTIFPSIAKKVPILGLVVCTFEAISELRGLQSASSMLKLLNLPPAFETMQDRPEVIDEILVQALQSLNQEYGPSDLQSIRAIRSLVRKKFPRLSQEQRVEKTNEYVEQLCGARHRSLNRRVYPRCSERVQQMVPQLLQEFSSMNPLEDLTAWRARACALLTDVKIQSKKKKLMHVIGLIAVIITVAGLITALCACPYLIPFALLISGVAFSCVRYGISEGMMNTQGWKFDPGNLIPDYVKLLYRKIFACCITCIRTQ